MLSAVNEKSIVRNPAVAGLFYPGDPDELRATVEGLLDTCPPPTRRRRAKALIVPHAGYIYSGAIAAAAYSILGSDTAHIRKVVLLGPSHRVAMRGLALPSADYFATPLGRVQVDAAGRKRLRELGLAGISDAPHLSEHSLEVQLPFLQTVLEDFELLPVAVGFGPSEQVTSALEAVWNGPETLIVVSSDLSHYHTYGEAQQLDDATTRSILACRSEVSDEQACGARIINGLLEVARHRGLKVKLLDQRNSGDTAGDRSRVVGYASYAIFDA
jgi:AmmeMemoRadiSam system protein B